MQRISLSGIQLLPEIEAQRERLRPLFEESSPAHLRLDDYRRWSVALNRVGGSSLLDIGPGVGQFVRAAAESGRFDRIACVDRKRHSKFQPHPVVDEIIADASATGLPDSSFDTVTCMEMLEHLTRDHMLTVLDELRRIARQSLVITLPFEEPEPLSSGHLQRFAADDLAILFPGASITVFMHGDRPKWCLVEERYDCRRSAK